MYCAHIRLAAFASIAALPISSAVSQPSHSYKFAASLQTVQSATPGCTRPVLLRAEAQGSHSYRPLDRRIAELADIWAFTAYHLGMQVRPTTAVVQ